MSPHLRPARLSVLLAACLGAGGLVGAAPARADTLLLRDGRTLECRSAVKAEDGRWRLTFENGEILLSGEQVKEVLSAGGQGYEPKNDEERALLAKGLVPHEGKWVPKAERDAKVAKRQAETKKRIEEAKAHREWMNRYKAKTQNFEFEYTIPPEIAKGYMDLLETFFGVFSKEFRIAKPKERLKVCFYHDYETFLQVSGAGYGTLAYYRFVPPLELNFFYDRLRPEETVAVMFHEAQHYLCHLMDLRFSMPHNFGEGFSEYYGGSRWDPVKKVMTTGGVQEGRLTEVKTDVDKGEMKGLEAFLKGELGYDDYTWGWTFVHFMMENPKYAKKFRAFYAALPGAKDVDRVPFRGDMLTVAPEALLKAFQKYMGIKDAAGLEALEAEWHAYVKDTLKPTGVTGFEEAAFAARNAGRPLRAKRLFKEAVEKGSKNPVVYLRYGELMESEDKALAERLFRQGLEHDPLSAALWTALGLLIKNREGEGNEEQGKKLIRLAAELDPDSVDTWLLVEEALQKVGPPSGPKPGEDGN